MKKSFFFHSQEQGKPKFEVRVTTRVYTVISATLPLPLYMEREPGSSPVQSSVTQAQLWLVTVYNGKSCSTALQQ